MIQQLKDYILKAEGNESLFFEEERLGHLTQASRKSVFSHITNYIVLNYTLAVKPIDIETICLASVEIFPSLKSTGADSNGIVS